MESLTDIPVSPHRSKKLFMVIFVTLFAAALIFLATFSYFEHLNHQVLHQIRQNANASIASSKLSRMVIRLELDVRELLGIITKNPKDLLPRRRQLLLRLEDQKKELGQNEQLAGDANLSMALNAYYQSLTGLLEEYSLVNNSMIEINQIFEELSGLLEMMEETTGQLMVDMAMQGLRVSAFEQLYILIPLCQENLVHSQMLIKTGVADIAPSRIGFNEGEIPSTATSMSAANNIDILQKTLRTLTSADERISNPARTIIDKIPEYEHHASIIAKSLKTIRSDELKFKENRNTLLNRLRIIDDQTTQNIAGIQNVIEEHEQKESIIVLFISAVILFVSGAGLLMSRHLSRQLEITAVQAIEAKHQEETINQQLQTEIQERQAIEEALKTSRDELDQRVQERTAELSDANTALQEEISDRIRTEKDLERERERLAVTLRSIGDGVVTTDVEGRVVLMNRVAEELTGWHQQEVLGRPLEEVFVTVGRELGSPSPLLKVLETGLSTDIEEASLISKNKTKISIQESYAAIRDSKSNIIGSVLVFRDVTEKQRMSQEILKVKKLESVGILAGGIAHDFNNILAAILGNISLALLYIDPGNKAHELLGEAEKASLRARDLTQQLLTFSKGGEPVKSLASIPEVIKESTDFVLRGSKIRPEYAFEESLRPVEIDTGQMSQVVQNIILNACHAMPDGGSIMINAANCLAKEKGNLALDGENFIKITIKDQGIGIAPNLLERIFDPYFTTKQTGSGLGLAITHSIIKKHGGSISASSELEKGTTFTIYLPASSQAMPVAQEQPKESYNKHGKGKILVMDDEKMVQDIATQMLNHLGFEVTVSSDGQDAIQKYSSALVSAPFDLVIMDLTIPGGMGGVEAVQEILKQDPDAKVIVSSGYSNDPIMANCTHYGFQAAAVKPYTLDNLSSVLAKVLTRKIHAKSTN